MRTDFNIFKTDENGLIPAVIQDFETKRVLMLGYMNEESYYRTLDTGRVTFYSRTRNTIWEKGETSGNYLYLMQIKVDCDKDTLLIEANPDGPTCHTGNETCFFEDVNISNSNADILYDLYEVIGDRKANPAANSYTTYLFNEGIDKILKKVGEESAETIIACKNDDREEIIYETSDLLYHLLVMLNDKEVEMDEIFEQLRGRREKN